MRPHVLGIDDAPFHKDQSQDVPIVGVMMEGATLVEGIAIGSFPVDGEGATEYLAQWITGLRWHLTLQAVVLGGITLAGLGIIDLENLAQHLALPVIAVTRHNPAQSRLSHAIAAAGFYERLPLLERIPPAHQLEPGLYMAIAGAELTDAAQIIRATLNKARFPEPLRLAHLIGTALVSGQSKGRA
jgi:hypothetical protein